MNILRLRLFTLTLLFCFNQIFSQALPSETTDKTKIEDPQPPPQRFSLKKEGGAKYITLYPGAQWMYNDLQITAPNGTKATMLDSKSVSENVQFLYDLKSKEWQLGKYFGFFILNRNVNFRQTRQEVYNTEPPKGASTSESSSSSSSSDGEIIKTRKNENLGTETFGSYSMVLPVLYYGKEGNNNFRLGAGFGIAKMNLQGTADFNQGYGFGTNFGIYYLGRNLEERIDTLGKYSLLTSGNIDGDPYRAYLLSNLAAGDNLEKLGLYSLLKGDVTLKSLDPRALLLYSSSANGTLTPLELYALASLGKGRVNSSSNYAKSYYLFWEIPFGDISWRLGFGGPFYSQNGFRISITGVEMALYTPVDF